MKNKEELNEELNKLSPFLARMKKENAFKVPQNYFSNLPDEILEQVKPQTTTQSSPQLNWLDRLVESISILFQPRYAVGFATVAILVIAGVFILQKPGNDLPVDNIDSPLAQYISDNIDDFDVDMLYELSVADIDLGDLFEESKNISAEEYMDEILDGLSDSDLEDLL